MTVAHFDSIDSNVPRIGSRSIRALPQESWALLDLRGKVVMQPSELVLLAAMCFALARDGHWPTIFVNDPGLRFYLKRVGFAKLVDKVARFKPPILTREADAFGASRGKRLDVIEITRIGRDSLYEILGRTVHVLQKRCRYRAADAYDVAVAISEVAQNIYQHNADTDGFLAVQVHKTATPITLEIGIADFGVGIAETLHVEDDGDAILKAVQPGATAHVGDPTHGTGLHRLLDIAERHDGTVELRSGDSCVRFHDVAQGGLVSKVMRLPGVQLTISLSTRATE
jgi:anti-sigma regulatory factor (Ser/Thr protein kinase)